MISILGGLFNTAIGRIMTACLVGLVALKAYGYQQRGKGAANAVAKIDATERKHGRKARRARNSSRAGGGVFDPYTRSNE